MKKINLPTLKEYEAIGEMQIAKYKNKWFNLKQRIKGILKI